MLQNIATFRSTSGRVILPDVCCDITVADGRRFFTGPLTSARSAVHSDKDVLLLRLSVTASSSLLPMPLSELTDRVIPLREVNRLLDDTVCRWAETGSISWLENHQYIKPDPRLVAAALALSHGSSVKLTAKEVNLSERQLERLMIHQAGVAPKQFARIVRFRRTVVAAASGVPLAGAALAQGYADQAHFARDVRAFTGRTWRSLIGRFGNVGYLQDMGSWARIGCEQSEWEIARNERGIHRPV